jgi:hypothetical protein
MSQNAQRLSQVVLTFGPGAMVDLPTRSVVIGGLELWDMRGGTFTTIPEPRLTLRLEQLLKSQGRLAEARSLSLRTPPVTDGSPGRLPPGIVAPVFPAWFVCFLPFSRLRKGRGWVCMPVFLIAGQRTWANIDLACVGCRHVPPVCPLPQCR